LLVFEEARKALGSPFRALGPGGLLIALSIALVGVSLYLLSTRRRLAAVKAEHEGTLERVRDLEITVTRLNEQLTSQGRRLRDFSDWLAALDPGGFVIDVWKENVAIRRGGDAEFERLVTIRPMRGQLKWWRFHAWGVDLNDAERQSVVPTVHLHPKGTRLNTHTVWLSQSRFDVFVDLLAPLGGETGSLTLVLRYKLPRAMAGLWLDRPEELTWRVEHGRPVHHMEYVVSIDDLPEGHHLVLNTIRLKQAPEITQAFGSWRVTGVEEDPPSDEPFGLRLDISPEG
jgi:hypothetical protein